MDVTFAAGSWTGTATQRISGVDQAAEIVLNDFRSGTIGRMTLETPEQFAIWQAEGEAAEAALKKKREARLNKRKEEQDEQD